MISVVLPTRGLVFTKVEEAIEKMRDENLRVYRSNNLPIPDGHNQLTKQALEDGSDYIFYIEEDTVPPTNALKLLLEADSDIACIDYGVAGWSCITRNREGEILWCGLGCTLVNAKVFKNLEYPYFRTDRTLRLNDMTWQVLPQSYIKTRGYGSLDIWFCDQARKQGFKITQAPGECDHLELLNLGKRETNHGLHNIGLKPRISKTQTIERG